MQKFDQVYQGDVSIIALGDYPLGMLEAEIPAQQHKVRLLEGELTGHHHELDLLAPVVGPSVNDPAPATKGKSSGKAPRFESDALNAIFDKEIKPATAKMFKAINLGINLVRDKVLTRADLVIGLLKVENGPMQVRHPEHNSILLPPGNYLIGRQIESVAGEERRVTD